MGRPAQGWKLSRKHGRRVHSVKFTHAGRAYELGTGEEDESKAAKRAAELYAAVVNGATTKKGRSKPRDARPLGPIAEDWVSSLTLDPRTVDSYSAYCETHFVPFFKTAEAIPGKATEYVRTRLRVVLAKTLKKELGALGQLAAFAAVDFVPPNVGKKTVGTRHKKGARSKVKLSPAEVAGILAALPERKRARGENARTGSTHLGHPVRARYVLMYETSLRPETLDLLRVPEHYSRGAEYLAIADEIDKARFGRQLPLSQVARAALDAIVPDVGLIFGRFRNPKTLRNAARAAGIEEGRASKLTPYDLRRARLTHLAEKGLLGAAQYMAGHRRISTTAIYAEGSLRAAEEAIR